MKCGFAILALLVWAGWPHASDIGMFNERSVNQFLECAARHPDAPATRCGSTPETLNAIGSDSITPLMVLLRRRAISPAGVADMLEHGVDPHVRYDHGDTAATYIAAVLPVEYLQALVNSGVDLYMSRGGAYSVIEASLLTWDDRKIDYLLENGFDLERRLMAGRTAILFVAGGAIDEAPFRRQLYLLERGADPSAVDSHGVGICSTIETHSDFYPTGPSNNYRSALAMELERRGIYCKESEFFRPYWRNRTN